MDAVIRCLRTGREAQSIAPLAAITDTVDVIGSDAVFCKARLIFR
jgi:hypothetical protein